MIPEHEAQAMRAQVEDLRAEARSLLNEGHKLRARLVSEAADGLARLLEERETLMKSLAAAQGTGAVPGAELALERDPAYIAMSLRNLADDLRALGWKRRAGYLDEAAAELSASPEEARDDPVLDALARGDESMAARLTTEREQMLRGRVVLTAEEAEQIARTIRRLQTHPTPGLRRAADAALALLLGRQHPEVRLDAANPQ